MSEKKATANATEFLHISSLNLCKMLIPKQQWQPRHRLGARNTTDDMQILISQSTLIPKETAILINKIPRTSQMGNEPSR